MFRSLIDRRLSVFLSALLGLAMLTFALTPALPQGSSGKKPIPTGPELKKSEDLILGEVFKDDLAKAKDDPAFASKLAAKMLQQARESKQFPSHSYVLYREALDLAARAGDIPLLLPIIDDLTQDFAVDPLEMKKTALAKAAKEKNTPEGYKALLDAALALSKEAAELDLYDTALHLGDVAEKAAVKLQNIPLIENMKKWNEGIKAQQNAFSTVKQYADQLKKDPGDAKANLEMGKYLCLFRNQWDRGLPLLAKGSDPQLKALAKQDLAKPKDEAGQVKAGDDWWDYAETAQVPAKPVKTNLQLRAIYWFDQALPQLKGFTRTRVAKRIDDIASAGAPNPVPIGPVGPVGQIHLLQGHTNPVNGVAFSPHGDRVLSGSTDQTMRLWDAIKGGKELQIFGGHTKMVWSVAFAPKRPQVFSGCWDGLVRMWDPKGGKELKRFPAMGETKDVNGIDISRDGHFLLSGSDDQSLRLWDIDKGTEVRRFLGHSNFVYGVAFSPNGQRAISASADGTFRYWDLKSGNEIRRWTSLGGGPTYHVAFTPDGLKGTFSGDDTVRLIDLEKDKVVQKFDNGTMVKTVAISPNGRRLLTGDANGVIKLWEVATGKEVHRFNGHTSAVVCVAFSPDGMRAVSGGDDNTVRVWGLPK